MHVPCNAFAVGFKTHLHISLDYLDPINPNFDMSSPECAVI